jgi:salicylate hydroxylase
VQPHMGWMRSYKGNVLSTVKLDGSGPGIRANTFFVIHRVDLHQILFEQAKELGAEVRVASEVTAVDFSVPSVTLANGETFRGDMVLGADGQRSFLQGQLTGSPVVLRDSGDEVIRFVVKNSELPESLVNPPNVHFWVGPDANAVGYSLKTDGLFNCVLTRAHAIGDQIKYGPQPMETSEVREAFKGWDPLLQELLGTAQSCAKWTLLVGDSVSKCTSDEGTFSLIGDAAHAMLPFL